jgi:hypothetical protein
MWWYAYGCWWWWMLFLIILFLLPLGYGWGYRGWGPWYRRRRPGDIGTGWGLAGVLLWVVFFHAQSNQLPVFKFLFEHENI